MFMRKSCIYSIALQATATDDLALLNSQLTLLAHQIPAVTAAASSTRESETKSSASETQKTIQEIVALIHKGDAMDWRDADALKLHIRSFLKAYVQVLARNDQKQLQELHADGNAIYQLIKPDNKNENLQGLRMFLEQIGFNASTFNKNAVDKTLVVLLASSQNDARELIEHDDRYDRLYSLHEGFNLYKQLAQSPYLQQIAPGFIAAYNAGPFQKLVRMVELSTLGDTIRELLRTMTKLDPETVEKVAHNLALMLQAYIKAISAGDTLEMNAIHQIIVHDVVGSAQGPFGSTLSEQLEKLGFKYGNYQSTLKSQKLLLTEELDGLQKLTDKLLKKKETITKKDAQELRETIITDTPLLTSVYVKKEFPELQAKFIKLYEQLKPLIEFIDKKFPQA
jgi:hypothetical protein